MTTYPMPGYVDDVVAFTTVEATTINAIRDRALQIFATTAARDSALTDPFVGQTAIVTTSSSAGEWIYYGSSLGWRRPWNLPWGHMATGTSTTDQVISGATNVTGQTATFTAVENRRYKTTASVGRIQKNTANGYASVYIVDASNNILREAQVWLNVNELAPATLTLVESGLSDGATTRRVRCESSINSIDVSGAGAPGDIVVEDIGPAGAP